MIATTDPIDVGEVYAVEISCEELDTRQIRQHQIVGKLGRELTVVDEFGILLQFGESEWLAMNPKLVD